MVRSNKEVVERKLVACRAAQADRVPYVGPLHVLGADQHGAVQLFAAGVELG
jgi:hypothetical protein